MKVGLILFLDEFGYPPVDKDEVFVEIFEPAENFKKNNPKRMEFESQYHFALRHPGNILKKNDLPKNNLPTKIEETNQNQCNPRNPLNP